MKAQIHFSSGRFRSGLANRLHKPFVKKKQINVLIITGGHDFEHTPFYNVFNGLPNVQL